MAHFSRHASYKQIHKRDLVPRFSPTAVFPSQSFSASAAIPSQRFGASAAISVAAPPSEIPVPVTTAGPPPRPEETTLVQDPITSSSSSTPKPQPTTVQPLPPSPTPPANTPVVNTSNTSHSSSATVSSTSPQPTTANVPPTQLVPVPAPATPSSSVTTGPNLPQNTVIPSWSTPSIVVSTSSGALAVASQSPSPVATSGTSIGAIVGGVVGGLAGLAAIVLISMFLLRHWRKRSDPIGWDADSARRQSAVLGNDVPSGDWNPRPPTMIERRYQNPPPVVQSAFGHQQTMAPGGYVNYSYDDPAFSRSAQPLFTPYGGQQSPLGSPTSVAYYDSAYSEQGHLVRQPSVPPAYFPGQPSLPGAYLSRQPSLPAASYNPAGDGHYTDLTRSSVSPFQAAQYAEISRRLHNPPPMLTISDAPAVTAGSHGSLPDSQTSAMADYTQQSTQHLSIPASQEDADPESPFADPAIGPKLVAVNGDKEEEGEALEPPSPVSSRVASVPPRLPEMSVQERAFSPIQLSFPASLRPGHSPLAVAPVQIQAALAPAARERELSAVRPETVYDETDAYGGI